jgi:hypothetical protein
VGARLAGAGCDPREKGREGERVGGGEEKNASSSSLAVVGQCASFAPPPKILGWNWPAGSFYMSAPFAQSTLLYVNYT